MNDNGWVFLFPGQGSQYVGMGKDFYDNYQEVKHLFEEASDILGFDVAGLCFKGPEDVLTLTSNVQAAVTVVNIACLKVMEIHGVKPVATAGHSLGEYSALYAAGVLKLDDVIRLVRLRGQLMQEASEEAPGGMIAVINADEETIKKMCEITGLEIANINSPDQIILTGMENSIKVALEKYRELGVKRCVRLKVSGPWHSKWMKKAEAVFREALADVPFENPHIPVVSNVDALPVKSAEEAREKLSVQITNPVYWHKSMKWFVDNGYTNFVEVGPKQVLTGLMKRITKAVNMTHVEDVPTLTGFLNGL